MSTKAIRRNKMVNIRLSRDEAERLRKIAEIDGHGTVSQLVRHWIASSSKLATIDESGLAGRGLTEPTLFRRFRQGKLFLGDSLGLLHHTLQPSSIDLIVTSPPFGLIRKKEYGNAPASQYLSWFRPFADGMRRVLKEHGSLVIDIGPAWTPGLPTKSLYQFDLLTMLCREFGFHLAQDFYWWNPSRMPAPAEWVNVRRLRAKDAVNPVWWLSPSPWPKASNLRVLTEYGHAQKQLFKNGYNSGQRPSGHLVSENWGRNNGGAIPPNLIAAPNTVSDDPYQVYCRNKGLSPHPARFPSAIPEFFIRMLTDEGDTVLDPFAGSCLTGAVANSMQRKFICGEIEAQYLEGALGRFQSSAPFSPPSVPKVGYRVPTLTQSEPHKARLEPTGGRDSRLRGTPGPKPPNRSRSR